MAKNTEIITTTKRPSFMRRALSWVWRKKWWIIIIAIILIGANMIFGGAKKAGEGVKNIVNKIKN